MLTPRSTSVSIKFETFVCFSRRVPFFIETDVDPGVGLGGSEGFPPHLDVDVTGTRFVGKFLLLAFVEISKILNRPVSTTRQKRVTTKGLPSSSGEEMDSPFRHLLLVGNFLCSFLLLHGLVLCCGETIWDVAEKKKK
jgi:hypothetical protein